MKKMQKEKKAKLLLAFLLAGIMLFGSVATALATEGDEPEATSVTEEVEEEAAEVEAQEATDSEEEDIEEVIAPEEEGGAEEDAFDIEVVEDVELYTAADRTNGTKVDYEGGKDTAYGIESWKRITYNGKTEVVYCLNQPKSPDSSKMDNRQLYNAMDDSYITSPVTSKSAGATWLDFAVYPNKVNVTTEQDDGSIATGATLADQMKQVLYNGYPYVSVDELSKKYGQLSEGEAYAATQSAVYYYAHGGTEIGVIVTGNAKKMRDDLISGKLTYPTDGKLYVYVNQAYDANGYLNQNFINVEEEVTPVPKTPEVKTKVKENEIEAAKDQSITDTVSLSGLTVGVEYTITGRLVDGEGNDVTATVSPITFTADAETAEKEMPFTGVDASGLAGKKIVVYETLSWKEGDTVKEEKHEDLTDTDQTVQVKESGEEPSETPTPTPEPTETPAPSETPTPSETPSAEETTGNIKTTVTAGGKTASASAAARLTYDEVSKAVKVVDAIDYKGLVAGATYTVKGTLVEVDASGKVVNESVATASQDLVAEDTSGTWSLDFGDVKLESYKKYVVFEEATEITDADGNETPDAETLEHKDAKDVAQTILTENENGKVLGDEEEPTKDDQKKPVKKADKPASGKEIKAVRTGDTFRPILWIALLAIAAVLVGVLVYRKRKA